MNPDEFLGCYNIKAERAYGRDATLWNTDGQRQTKRTHRVPGTNEQSKGRRGRAPIPQDTNRQHQMERARRDRDPTLWDTDIRQTERTTRGRDLAIWGTDGRETERRRPPREGSGRDPTLRDKDGHQAERARRGRNSTIQGTGGRQMEMIERGKDPTLRDTGGRQPERTVRGKDSTQRDTDGCQAKRTRWGKEESARDSTLRDTDGRQTERAQQSRDPTQRDTTRRHTERTQWGREGSGRDPTLRDTDGHRQTQKTQQDANNEGSNFSQDYKTVDMTKAAIVQRALKIIQEDRKKIGSQASNLESHKQKQCNFGQSASESRELYNINESYDSSGDKQSYNNRAQLRTCNQRKRGLDTLFPIMNMDYYPTWPDRRSNRGNDFIKHGRHIPNTNAFSHSSDKKMNSDRGNNINFSVSQNEGIDYSRGQQIQKGWFHEGRNENQNSAKIYRLPGSEIYEKTQPFNRKRDSEGYLRNSGWKQPFSGMEGQPVDRHGKPHQDFSVPQFQDNPFIGNKQFGRTHEDSEGFPRNSGLKPPFPSMNDQPVDLKSHEKPSQDFSVRQFQDNSFGGNRNFGRTHDSKRLINAGWKPPFTVIQDQPINQELVEKPYQDLPTRQSKFQDDSFTGNKNVGGKQDSNVMVQENLEQAPVVNDHCEMFLVNLPKTCTELSLKQYFSNYGEVRRVDISRDEKTKMPLSRGKVCFSESYMVKLALRHDPHFIDGEKIRVARILKPSLEDATCCSKEIDKSPQKNQSKIQVFNLKSKLLKMQRKKGDRHCQKPSRDPHVFCIFCQAAYTKSMKGCFRGKCLECETLTEKERDALIKDWLAQMKNTAHPCYWNMADLSEKLEPFNITAKSAICGLCDETFEVESLIQHLKKEKHKRSARNRSVVAADTFDSIYKCYIELCNQEEMSGIRLKLCSECFMQHGEKESHLKKILHSMMVNCRRTYCEVCDEFYNTSTDIRKHPYSDSHLLNAWHKKVMSGEEMPSDDLEFIGKEFVGVKTVGWCFVCKVNIECGGAASIKHCKTKDHFDKVKIKKEKLQQRAAERNEYPDYMEMDEETPEDDPVADEEGAKDDAVMVEKGTEDDTAVNEKGTEDDAIVNEEDSEDDTAVDEKGTEDDDDDDAMEADGYANVLKMLL